MENPGHCPTCGRRNVSKAPLTPVQKAVYRFLVRYREEYDSSPTLQEIADHMDWRSLASAHSALSFLVNKGWVEQLEYGGTRAYVPIVEEGVTR